MPRTTIVVLLMLSAGCYHASIETRDEAGE